MKSDVAEQLKPINDENLHTNEAWNLLKNVLTSATTTHTKNKQIKMYYPLGKWENKQTA